MWIAKSIANSIKLDDGDGDGDGSGNGDERGNNDAGDVNYTDSKSTPRPEPKQHSQSTSPSSTTTAKTPRGVKEDLSELTKSFTRQFWDVASFLAPPPDSFTPPPNSPPSPSPHPPQISDVQTGPHRKSDPSESLNEEDLITGIRSDFAEIGGKFKSGISKLSSNKAVSEITKIASNLLQIGAERDFSDHHLIGSVVGVTEEVVVFARDIAMHPETWLDFPVLNDDDFDEFDMSDVQQEHALAVEQLAPRLAALRMELCPGYMSEACFWRIYFVLVHPRLSKTDALLLSSPQILETRAMLSMELHKRTKGRPAADWSDTGAPISKETTESREVSLFVPHHAESESVPPKKSSSEVAPLIGVAKTSSIEDISVAAELETDKHPLQSTEIEIIDKVVVEEEPINESKHQHSSPVGSFRVLDEKFEDGDDDWLKEESLEMVGASKTALSINDDEDVSFSDLEEEDEDVATTYKKVVSSSNTSRKTPEIGFS